MGKRKTKKQTEKTTELEVVDEEAVVEEVPEEPTEEQLNAPESFIEYDSTKHEVNFGFEDLISSIEELPEPLMTPTQRQYGEEFLPEYVKVRARLRRLAGLP